MPNEIGTILIKLRTDKSIMNKCVIQQDRNGCCNNCRLEGGVQFVIWVIGKKLICRALYINMNILAGITVIQIIQNNIF